MSLIKNTDSVLKLLISIVFRGIIIAYSFFLISTYPNLFEKHWYFAAIGGYLVIYSALFNKHKLLSFLRLVNDYTFMGFMIYGKPAENLDIALLLLLPLVNNINHSGKRKIRPFSLRLYSVILITHFIVNQYKFDWAFLTAVLTIGCINGLIFFRFYLINYVNHLNSIIEEFYRDNLNIGKTHRILKEVVVKHKENKFVNNWVPLCNIVLFELREKKGLKILLSSEFIPTVSIPHSNKLYETLLDSYEVKNHKIILNGQESNYNLYVLNIYKDIKYVFFVEFCRQAPFNVAFDIYLSKVLQPLFTKIVQVAYIEYQLNLESKKYFKELKNRLENIDSAVNAIHYLNNKLSPVLNYFEMLRLLPKADPNKIDALKSLIETEKKNVINSLKPITDKMNQMAEKTMNPRIISDTKLISLRKLFAIIRNSCDDDNAVEFNYKIDWSDETFDKRIFTNLNLFTFIVDELIINLEKHSTGSCVVSFIEKDIPQISFKNTIKNIDRNRNSINKLIQSFNTDNVNEIMKRASNGLRIVKEYLIQLEIKHQMTLENDNLVLTLILKIEDENRHI